MDIQVSSSKLADHRVAFRRPSEIKIKLTNHNELEAMDNTGPRGKSVTEEVGVPGSQLS